MNETRRHATAVRSCIGFAVQHNSMADPRGLVEDVFNESHLV
jgi:hypothetical protein